MADKTALLVVDVQKGFVNDETRRVLPAIRHLMADFTGKPIFVSQFFNAWDSGFRKYLDYTEMDLNAPEQALAIPVPDDAIFIPKKSYSSFNPYFEDMLQLRGIQELHICGLETDACILATAMDVMSRTTIRPVVHAEACACRGGRACHDQAMAILRRNIGDAQVVGAR